MANDTSETEAAEPVLESPSAMMGPCEISPDYQHHASISDVSSNDRFQVCIYCEHLY